MEAKKGRSYPYIVDEIFDIDKYFDVETEGKLEKFYRLRDEILKGNRKKISGISGYEPHTGRKKP